MIRIGLTGGIGAGKSTVAATFSECGGIVVDGDVIAREVVEPGTEGLAQLVETFGDDILAPDGALNRPALAAKAFVDDEQRTKLNQIVHPLVGKRRQEIIDAVSEDAVVVEDIPLLVETGMAPMFPLVVVVTADIETRVTRVVQQRGMDEADARARIKAQAPEEQRRAIADVLLDNSGSQGELVEKARDLWYNRVLPLAHNIRTRQGVQYDYKLVPYDPTWPEQAQRIIKRIQTACGAKVLRVDHIGSTAVPGMDGKDVIDIQVTVQSLDIADELVDPLTNVGYPRVEGITTDMPHAGDPVVWSKRFHAAADPGRPANIHVRVDGWPNQQAALLFPEWLKAIPDARDEYVAVKRGATASPDYVQAKERWLSDAYHRAWEWANVTGWRP